MPSTAVVPSALEPAPLPRAGLRGWLSGLSPRDRAVYGLIMALMLLIIGAYGVLTVQLMRGGTIENKPTVGPPTTVIQATITAGPSATGAPAPSPTSAPTLSATLAPTASPVPAPSDTPVPASPTPASPGLPQPTTYVPPPVATATSVLPVDTVTPLPDLTMTSQAETSIAATATSAAQPTVTPAPPTATTGSVVPTVTPPPPPPATETTAPPPPATETTAPPPPPPTEAPPPPTEPPFPTVAPTAFSGAATTQQWLTLYFPDATGTVFVPVVRLSPVVGQQVASAALRELIAGPRGDLRAVVPGDLRVLGIVRQGNTIIANFDRRPALGQDERGLQAVALTLSEFSGVEYVQIQVNGANLGGPLSRPVLNTDNPRGLSEDYRSGSRFLPLYFCLNPSPGCNYRVRITRIIERTDAVAEATVRALLAGPGGYGGLLSSVIPGGTELRGIRADGSRVVVDLSESFANAADRHAALDLLVLSLTELRTPQGTRRFTTVEVLIEGRRLGEFWGPEFDRQFERPALNHE